jgi:hypothetical protein
MLNECLVHEKKVTHGNGGPWTACLCAPIDQNHQLSKLDSDDFKIAHDFMQYNLSSNAFK